MQIKVVEMVVYGWIGQNGGCIGVYCEEFGNVSIEQIGKILLNVEI